MFKFAQFTSPNGSYPFRSFLLVARHQIQSVLWQWPARQTIVRLTIAYLKWVTLKIDKIFVKKLYWKICVRIPLELNCHLHHCWALPARRVVRLLSIFDHVRVVSVKKKEQKRISKKNHLPYKYLFKCKYMWCSY